MPTPDKTFRPLLNAVNCGAILVDGRGVVVLANGRFCEMMARAREEIVGRPIMDFYADSEDIAFLESLIASVSSHEGEFHVVRPDGEKLPVIVSGRALEHDGTAPHRLVTIIDISGQKEAEAQLAARLETVSSLSDTVIEQAIELKHHSELLEDRVRERTAELHEANMEAITMLAVASEAKDTDTGAHVHRIRSYTEQLSRELGLSGETVEQFGYSAILHDVGKMIVPDHILKKPGKLTDDEWTTMRQHTAAGERILSRKPFFDTARRIARSHHENWDGSGYPDGLQGDAIPLAARIVRVADVFDALISPRVYKQAWAPEQAAYEIFSGKGRLFDPQVVTAFRTLFSSGSLRR